MTISEMLQQSAVLSVVGMATVFIFLAIMVVIIDVIGKFIGKAEEKKQENNTSVNAQNVSPEIVAVISTAISEYRKNNE